LIFCVKSHGIIKSSVSKGGFSTIQSAEEIAISNLPVQKAAWAYLQPPPQTIIKHHHHCFKKIPSGSRLEQLISHEYASEVHQQPSEFLMAIILLSSCAEFCGFFSN